MKKLNNAKVPQNSNSFVKGIGIGLLLLVGIVGLFESSNYFQRNIPKVKSVSNNLPTKTINKQIALFSFPTKIPSPTPSPTVTPTKIQKVITPEKPAGYCLYVPILMYHHIEPLQDAKKEGHGSLTVDSSFFQQQISYLNDKKYTTITVDDLAHALINHSGLPSKPIILTADDGYKDIFDNAFPLLQQYNIKLNLMIPTGLVGGGDYLTWDQIKQMVGSGLITAYDHTWSHASLGNATQDKIHYEISTAKGQLEQNLGKPVNIFAYPYGSESPAVFSELKNEGFIAGLSTIGGSYQCDSFIYSFHRTRIGNVLLSAYGF